MPDASACQPDSSFALDSVGTSGIMHAVMHWDYIIILIVLAVVLPWRSTARIRELLTLPELSAIGRVRLYLSTIIFQWIISAAILWRLSTYGMKPAYIGLAVPYPGRAAALAAGLSALLIINQICGIKRLAGLPREHRGLIGRMAEKLLPRSRSELFLAMLLLATVAICEELIYRGFVETIFQTAMRSQALGAVISAAFFAVAHLYQGRRGLMTTFAVGLMLSVVRIWSSSLLPSAIIHFGVDFTAGVAARRMLLEAPPPSIASIHSEHKRT